MNKIKVKHSLGEYDIYIGDNILKDALSDFFKKAEYDRVFIVTDSNVDKFCLPELEDAMVGIGIKPCGKFVFEAGEKSKNLSTVNSMYEAFVKAELTRKSLVVALGGGVVGDMAGFASATYLRGTDILQIPTSLLAQIDSSIGGKTGIDLTFGKNLVGAFHQPVAVISDSRFLNTLPQKYLNDGMGEAIKTGLIGDRILFEKIADKTITNAELIERCAKFKAQIVTSDEYESGLRKILNYGHTVGHAVEKLGNFSKYSHGESVGIGMLYAANIAKKLGYIDIFDKTEKVLKEYGLPTETNYSSDELISIISSDKKRELDHVSFVFTDEIGHAVLQNIELEKLRGLL